MRSFSRIPEKRAVVIGGSAGSIPVINAILFHLKPKLSLPIIICVHRMKNTSEGMKEVFSNSTFCTVIEPNDKEEISAGKIYLAPSNYHLLIEHDKTFSLSTDEPVNYSRPAIDVTFQTAANNYKRNLTGILLTGANHDGAFGMNCIKQCGGITIVQKPSECAASTMPQAAIALNCVDHIMSTDQIISYLIQLLS